MAFKDMKPIETRYKGYRFRSRLEARWAVYFDALDIAYEYEKEGYELGSAGKYLPDFWLPSAKCWVEIKADKPTISEINKLAYLCLATESTGYIYSGLPHYTAAAAGFRFIQWGEVPFPEDPLSKPFETPFRIIPSEHLVKTSIFPDYPHNERGYVLMIEPMQYHGQRGLVDSVELTFMVENGPHFVGYDAENEDQPWFTDKVIKAVNIATAARFEHGETPNGGQV